VRVVRFVRRGRQRVMGHDDVPHEPFPKRLLILSKEDTHASSSQRGRHSVGGNGRNCTRQSGERVHDEQIGHVSAADRVQYIRVPLVHPRADRAQVPGAGARCARRIGLCDASASADGREHSRGPTAEPELDRCSGLQPAER